MVDSMDWQALMSSEVFREYFKNEAPKYIKKSEVVQKEEDVLPLLDQLSEFEREVKSSPKKLQIFKALKRKFETDPEYTAQVKKAFVEAVMMLNLD